MGSTNRNFRFLADFTAKDRLLAERALKELDERQRNADEAKAKKADAVVAEAQGQLQALVGAEQLAQLRKAMQAEGLAFADALQPPGGLALDRDKANVARKRRINTLAKKFGASVEQLRKIGADTKAKLDDILATPEVKPTAGFNLSRNLDLWLSLSELHKFTLPWGVHPDIGTEPNAWQLERPPWFGFDFKFSPQVSDNFRVDRLHYLDPGAGVVGQLATMDCDSAGDFDYASATVDTLIAFGFMPTTTGRLEVLIDAQFQLGTHHLRTEEEWGWSESWTNQNNFLMMRILHPDSPEPSLALMSNLYKEEDGDSTWNVENLTRGQHYFAHLHSSGPIPAGQHVVVEVGTRTFDITRANDVEVHSATEFQWFVNSVEVRISL